MAIALQVRRKVPGALGRDESAAAIARRLEVGERSVYRLQRRARGGRPLEPLATGPRGPTKLTPGNLRMLREAVEQDRSVTAGQVIPRLSMPVAVSTVCRAWKRMGLSLQEPDSGNTNSRG